VYFFSIQTLKRISNNNKRNSIELLKESLIKLLLPLLKVFGNKNFAALHEVTGMEGHFFRGKMKITNLTVFVENDDIHINFETQTHDNRIFVTPETIDKLCERLQKIKKIADPYNYEV
jgi:hypothetical protein